MTKNKLKRTTDRNFKVTPGYIVVNCSTAKGGIHYKRTPISEHKINAGKGLQSDHRTKKTVDHLEAVALVDGAVKKADYACRVHGANTVLGWYVDDISLAALKADIALIEVEAAQANQVARACGSKREAYISIVPLKIDAASEEAAREIARTIREVLGDVITALRSGHVKKSKDGKIEDKLHAPLLRCKNLDRLAVGLAGESVKIALQRIPEAKKEITEAVKNGDDPATVGAALDLEAIENAISWFAENALGDGTNTNAAIDDALRAEA